MSYDEDSMEIDTVASRREARDRERDRDNWEPEEITALFTVWKKYVAELDRANHKRLVYKKMSDKLKLVGVKQDHFAVQLKINKLKGLYRKSMPTSGHKSKWRYWASVDEILGEPDSDEESWDDEAAGSSESEASEPVQTKKMRAISTRSTPKRQEVPVAASTPKIRVKILRPKPPPAPKPEKVRKPPPPDEILDNLLLQDKKLKDHTLKLINMYKDNVSRISNMQKTSTDNLVALATEFERYLKSRKNDLVQEESVEDKVNALLDNDLTNVTLNSLLPQTFKNVALMPLLKTVLSQFTPPPPMPMSNEMCMMDKYNDHKY